MKILEKLKSIQHEMKVPKNQWNGFGGYSYRSCESILEALKPLEEKYGIMITISDDLEMLGDRYYVKSTVRLYDTESDEAPIEVSAWAREASSKKGMDEAQITGAASSYARKYALNGLFLLDDTKDHDAYELHGDEKITKDMVQKLRQAIAEVGVEEEKLLSAFGLEAITEFSVAQYNKALKRVEATRKAKSDNSQKSQQKSSAA